MAVDEAILGCFIAGEAPPTLRFYGWTQPAVTIGRLQPVSSVPEGWGTCVVRRPTGGRAVRHGTDLTFSLVCEAAELGSPVRESYRRVGQAVASALLVLGLPAQFCRSTTAPSSVRRTADCFELTLDHEVSVGGRKVLGSAQTRRSGAVLQQNSLAGPPGRWWPDCGRLAAAVADALEAEFGVELVRGELSAAEIRIARTLADSKYAAEAWTLLRSV